MADISGYTAFVGGTEQEHSQEIVAELMDGISRSFGGNILPATGLITIVLGHQLLTLVEEVRASLTVLLTRVSRIANKLN